jgi:hypothetical protein
MSKTATAEKPGTAVAATKTTAVATPNAYGEDAGLGFEGTTAKDLAIPFLGILQTNSPQVEGGDKPVEGAKPGMIINTVTGELHDGSKGVPFIPVHYDRAFVEWKPRDAGGGFVASHDPDSELVKAEVAKQPRGKIILANKNELIETEYCYGLVLDADFETVLGFAVQSITSTKLTPWRKFKSALYMLKGRPPLLANRAVLMTEKQKNEKGTFFNAKYVPAKGTWLTSLIAPDSPLLQEAKEFRQLVITGIAKAAFETQNAAGDTGSGNTEDAPF